MNKNKIITLVIISTVGVGMFIFFINLLSGDDEELVDSISSIANEEAESNSATSTVLVEEGTTDDPAVSQLDENQQSSDESVKISDGVYNAFVKYLVPQGVRESIDVTLTVEDGVIIDAEIDHVANDRESEFYQSSFDTSYESKVIGEKIDELQLSRVGGASLTTDAFMEAVDEIINEMNAAT